MLLARYIGSPLPIRECFAELLQTADTEQIARAVAAYRRRFEAIGMFENRLYPGVEEALAALRSRGATLHVVTAKPAVDAREIIRHCGIDGHFSSLVGPGMEETRFTKGDLIRKALSENDASPSDAVAIGDRAADIIGARENGVRSIGVTWGMASPRSWPKRMPWSIRGRTLLSVFNVQPNRGWTRRRRRGGDAGSTRSVGGRRGSAPFRYTA